MKNKFKRTIAFIASFAMVLTMMLSANINVDAANRAKKDSYTLTIQAHENCTTDHHYEAYQIFEGVVSDAEGDEGLLTSIKWGNGITDAGKDYFTKSEKYNFEGNIDKFVEHIRKLDTTDKKEALAEEFNTYLQNPIAFPGKSNNAYVLENVKPGYYLIKDKDNSLDAGPTTDIHDAYTNYILKVTRDQTITPKSTYPTVDKEVSDEKDELAVQSSDTRLYSTSNLNTWDLNNEWVEAADHEINERFQFRLTANVPIEAHTTSLPNYDPFSEYDTYTIKFYDKLSDGVTFESIQRVYVEIGNSTTSNTYDLGTTEYSTNTTDQQGKDGIEFELSVNDLKKINGTKYDYTDMTYLKVYVVYNAHLNEKALTYSASTDENGVVTNNNEVYLTYSNDPYHSDAYGKTPKDKVWVFAYNVHLKKSDTTTKRVLENVGFRLYTNDLNGGKKGVSLIYDESISAYRPVKGNEEGVEIKTNASGEFNIKGLDAGQYYLRETTPLPGYDAPENDWTINISAAHNETAGGNTATLDLTGSTNMELDVNNTKSTALPQTGGIGNYIFYGIGFIMIVSGVTYFAKRKRSE